jgi:outer membrane protein, heavy metal efflux system
MRAHQSALVSARPGAARWRRACLAVAAGLVSACAHYTPRPISPPAALDALESRQLGDAALAAFFQANHEPSAWPPSEWDLHALTLAAFYYHPDLDVARGSWAEARAALITAGQRENPNLGAGAGYNSTSLVSEITPWILSLDLNFTIETGGKRGKRIARAQRLSESARLNIATVAWRVQSGVRTALLDVYAATALEALLQQRETIQERNLVLLERQLAAGEISSFEMTQARMTRDAVAIAIYDARREQATGRVALAAALGTTGRALDSIPLSFAAFDVMPPPLSVTDARREALLNRPDVLGALMEYEAAQASLSLEVARQYPDIHLGPGLEMDQGENKWMLGLGAVLPVINRNKGPIAESLARRETAAARFTSVQSRAIEEIDGALAAYQAALAKMTAIDSLLANRERQEQVANLQLTAGAISQLDLGQIQLELTNAELARLDGRVEVLRALGQVEDALQRPVGIADWVYVAPPRGAPPPMTHHTREPHDDD